ncbi:cyclin-dependent kinase inhibitor 3 family protein [Methylobacterium sp. NEAU K]|uniref:cyclin-dependent kinase inhibitor 3 family protein n=1 Tax=Methylobacterium sp. NEAU K TaxID=3064946 RepID=UPI0027328B5F|nr:cyclin-dependent kinase inhibitor 3 family protein [Methylobacterium sp. NEAU K]MDP4002903.1 cyclin-dependent kinase inhibitor 3 family protein [Methylobacterium sp. NEAU K]
MTKDDIWHVGQAVFGSHSLPRSQSPVRTSLTHPLQIASIPVGDNGGLIGITFCPGKKDPSSVGGPWERDLGADITVICEWGASSVLTLIEPHEFDFLSVRGLPDAVRDAGLVWHHAPIPDVSVPGPAFRAAWRTIGPRISEQLREGGSVVVHCRGGLGRAGMVAAKLLVMMGEDPRRAIERVRAVRPGAIETREQEAYVLGQGASNV